MYFVLLIRLISYTFTNTHGHALGNVSARTLFGKDEGAYLTGMEIFNSLSLSFKHCERAFLCEALERFFRNRKSVIGNEMQWRMIMICFENVCNFLECFQWKVDLRSAKESVRIVR